ncbi:hypothetical protein [Leptospira mayottensis]|uniref:Uncharacterized protein n=1 Tax=Leptospira mayottensis TaxID=1137606 RepID=A0ABM6YBP0_9LEPT|nr:hypothetical protein [Leptospira mayottensis]AXR61439.1 hypothetical protein DQM68_12860 [Leptospira mayottensis]AXR65318.1 hypothetical protein DQM28_14945 [Leptospira mayottensis]AZQ02122.1 hypothetical protein LEP1GSC190_08860 [Leptospira mayottensis 200901116]TGN10144.1 hypothetical protein EHR03_07595 [Leptospira mayottensis]
MDGKAYATQIGLFNQSERGSTIQIGAVNKVESERNSHSGIQLGFYNEVTEKNRQSNHGHRYLLHNRYLQLW